MDRLLATSGWEEIPSSPNEGRFDHVKRKVALYRAIKDNEAWKDHLHALSTLRKGTQLALERGLVDNYGRTHEPEQRALLYALDQILAYYPSLEGEYERGLEVLKGEEGMANRPLYGEDKFTQLTADF